MLKLTKLLTLYIFCCFSCADKTSSIPKVINTKFANKISLELSDSVFFSIDSTTSIYTPSLQYFEAKRNILAFLNTNNNSAYLFDYESRKLNKVIRFENEGPNGVGPIEGFKIHNFDTFMVNSRYKLFLTDTTGKPFFNFDFYKNRPPDLEVTGLIANETKRPMEIMGNKAYVDVMPDVDFSDLDQISQSKVKFILDLKTNSYTADLNYTDNYLEGVFGVHYLDRKSVV